jgi:hypothetical protein
MYASDINVGGNTNRALLAARWKASFSMWSPRLFVTAKPAEVKQKLKIPRQPCSRCEAIMLQVYTKFFLIFAHDQVTSRLITTGVASALNAAPALSNPVYVAMKAASNNRYWIYVI